MNGLLVAGAVTSGVGALVFLLGWRAGAANQAFRERATRVRGTIVSLHPDTDVNAPVVEFTDADGRVRTVHGRTNAGRGGVVGSTLVVYYDPKEPGSARLAQDMVATPAVMLFLGGVLVLSGGSMGASACLFGA